RHFCRTAQLCPQHYDRHHGVTVGVTSIDRYGIFFGSDATAIGTSKRSLSQRFISRVSCASVAAILRSRQLGPELRRIRRLNDSEIRPRSQRVGNRASSHSVPRYKYPYTLPPRICQSFRLLASWPEKTRSVQVFAS